MLAAEGLSKSYQGKRVVEEVSIALGGGRVVGLVGANGAGKTTTLKMLAGLLEPTEGQALVDGQPTLRPEVRRAIGYLSEDSPLYEDLTPLSYLAFFGALYDLSRAESRAKGEDLLRRLQCGPEHWKKPIGTLSKGLRRKVAIARCLLHQPSVLLLDEPTSGLDTFTTREVNAFLKELRAQGVAILLSAHNMPQVEELCDEILIMHDGRIVDRGTLADLRQRLGTQRYRVRATIPFPESVMSGPIHEAVFGSLRAVESAIEAVREGRGVVLEVESQPPKLEEILHKAAGG